MELKEILEIVGIVVALVLSVLAAAKYWSAAKTAKEFSSDLGKLYDRVREVETNVHKAMATCQASHGDFNNKVQKHIEDRGQHRDSELESFRYDTLARAIGDLKTDLSNSIDKIETSLCERIGALERTVRNGNGAKA